MSGVGCSLLPPPFSCLRIPLPIKSWMCRSAVWCELSVSFAHFSVVSFPSKSYVLEDPGSEQTKSGFGLNAPWGILVPPREEKPDCTQLTTSLMYRR